MEPATLRDMDVYGLTGGIGSGKSTAAALLEEYGVPVVSADELSRVVVAQGSEGLRAVVDTFGSEIVDEHGELDRRRMAKLVFRDPKRRRELEAILHPRIRDRFEQVLDALEKAGHDVCVYEVPLLFERDLQGEMKAVILVTANMEDRVARVRARDDVTETEVRARIAAQMDEDTKRRRADYIIENTGNLDDLRREIEFVLARFLRIGQTSRRPRASQAQAGAFITGTTIPPSISLADAETDTDADTDADGAPPSRRPTAVPTEAPASITAPLDTPQSDRETGPTTIVETGPPPGATRDTIHPVEPASVTPPPLPPPAPPTVPSKRATVEIDAVAEEERITRIDTGPPSKG